MKLKLSVLVAAMAALAASSGGWAACSADIDMGANKIVNVGTPTDAADVATKAYVDAAMAGVLMPTTCDSEDGAGVGFKQAVAACKAKGMRLPNNAGELLYA